MPNSKKISPLIASSLCLLLVSGCAGVTDVVPTGKDTFMVASHSTMGWSSGPAQKAKAMQDAGQYCAKQGKQLQVISTNEQPGGFGQIASGEVHFRCVQP